MKKTITASEILSAIVKDSKSDRIYISDITNALHESGFSILMLIFAVLILPFPTGLDAIPAIPLFIFSIQMMLGMDSPRLPKFINNMSFKKSTLSSIVGTIEPHLKTVENMLRPRLPFVSSKNGERVIGLFTAIFCIFIMIPVPFTHTLPIIGILIMSLGLLGRDGITIMAGMAAGLVGAFITSFILLMGEQAIAGIAG